jgi:hypothetical protein
MNSSHSHPTPRCHRSTSGRAVTGSIKSEMVMTFFSSQTHFNPGSVTRRRLIKASFSSKIPLRETEFPSPIATQNHHYEENFFTFFHP